MRYTYAKFVGYIGFYNGLGLDQLEIDFTKSQHKIIMISGINGCGKSTLMNALNLFPDASGSFVPDRNARKILEIEDNGNIYHIDIHSDADMKGGRKTTKAYIQKNGQELNENGNVSSYKETIFSEFELDNNYLSLSKLSASEKGLANKTPSERKKFASNIIDNLETYNDMYKTLNKKSLIYKSHINTLHTKIQNIGDRTLLETNLQNLKMQEKSINDKILFCNNQIVSIRAKSSIDENEARRIQKLTDHKLELSKQQNSIQIQLDKLYSSTKIKPDDVQSVYDKNHELMIQYKTQVESLSDRWKTNSEKLSDNNQKINSMRADIYNSESNIDETISEQYDISNQKIHQYEKELSDLGQKPNPNSIQPLTDLISLYKRLVSMIDNLSEGLVLSDLDYIVNRYDSSDVAKLQNSITDIQNQVLSEKDNLTKLQNEFSTISVLEQRPKNCKIDGCPFVKDALDIQKKYKNLENLANLVAEQMQGINDHSIKSTELLDELDHMRILDQKHKEYYLICNEVENLRDTMIAYDPEVYYTLGQWIATANPLNELRNPKRIQDILNLQIQLQAEVSHNHVLSVQYDSYMDKKKLVDKTKELIRSLEKEQSELSISVSDNHNKIIEFNKSIGELEHRCSEETIYLQWIEKMQNITGEIQTIEHDLKSFESKSDLAMRALSEIEVNQQTIAQETEKLKPVTDQINIISGQLVLLGSYYKEYEEYKQSYDTIEMIKKYCSPTGGGIQTIFMQLYMRKTLELSNELLSMLFGGEYQLLDFIINDKEFRIPFVGSGLPVDDISNGSASQVDIMGMAINLVLLYQASTHYNIARLDEVSGSLDTYNRSQFIGVLERMADVLKFDQIFCISHDSEIDNANVDMIKLKSLEAYDTTNNSSANIIYNYQEIIRNS